MTLASHYQIKVMRMSFYLYKFINKGKYDAFYLVFGYVNNYILLGIIISRMDYVFS